MIVLACYNSAMLRLATLGDTPAIIALWLEASRLAHDFIPYAFWQERTEDMRSVYLPQAETYVAEADGRVVAFIALVEEHLAALFVQPAAQGQGHGYRLLSLARQIRPRLELSVYERNQAARAFYVRAGFETLTRRLDPASHEPELVMQWRRADSPARESF